MCSPTWLEMEILQYLVDRRHPVSVKAMQKEVAPENEESTVSMTTKLEDRGYVKTWRLEDQTLMVEITPLGRNDYSRLVAPAAASK